MQQIYRSIQLEENISKRADVRVDKDLAKQAWCTALWNVRQ